MMNLISGINDDGKWEQEHENTNKTAKQTDPLLSPDFTMK